MKDTDWKPTELDKTINALISDFEETVATTHFKDVYELAAAEKERNRKIIQAVLSDRQGVNSIPFTGGHQECQTPD